MDVDLITDLEVRAAATVPTEAGRVWDLVADVTRIGEFSPECVAGGWQTEADGPRVGARFWGRNRDDEGAEWTTTCQVTIADRPTEFSWVVLDDRDDPDRPSSTWWYGLEAVSERLTVVTHRFVHGPGGSGLRDAVEADLPRGLEIRAAWRNQLEAHMIATLGQIRRAAVAAPERRSAGPLAGS